MEKGPKTLSSFGDLGYIVHWDGKCKMRQYKELSLNFLPYLNRHIHNGDGGQKMSNQQDLAAQGDEGGFASRPEKVLGLCGVDWHWCAG